MDYKELIEKLKEWNEYWISEFCADDKLMCDELCGGGDCIVMQAITAIETLLAETNKEV